MPLQFTVALDVRYRRLEQAIGISAVRVESEASLRVARYADDTAVYLNDVTMVDVCLRELHVFGVAFVFRVNIKKSVAVRLPTTTACSVRSHCSATSAACSVALPAQEPSVTCRYLGTQVGLGPMEQANWSGMIGSLRHLPLPARSRQCNGRTSCAPSPCSRLLL